MNTAEARGQPLRKDAQHNRQRIIDSARELFAVRGLEATHNEVARHAGVGVGTVYRRFPTKQSLVEAIFEDGIDEITGFAQESLDHPDSWQGLTYFIDEMCQLTARDRGLREAIFSSDHGGDRITAARLRLDPIIAEVVDNARADGHLRPGISPTDMPVASLLAGVVTEFAGDLRPELWRRYMTIFLDGMRAWPGQPPLPVEALSARQFDAAKRKWDSSRVP